jgi:hypothetical protein
MSTWLLVGIGAAVVGFVAVGSRRGQSFSGALQRAKRQGELDGLIQAIERAPKIEQATLWDQAIGRLWQSYERQTAARLAREAVQRSDAQILQYWLKQIMEVEPEIAAEVFDQAFLLAFFQPEVAKSCGRCGSCGCS